GGGISRQKYRLEPEGSSTERNDRRTRVEIQVQDLLPSWVDGETAASDPAGRDRNTGSGLRAGLEVPWRAERIAGQGYTIRKTTAGTAGDDRCSVRGQNHAKLLVGTGRQAEICADSREKALIGRAEQVHQVRSFFETGREIYEAGVARKGVGIRARLQVAD